MAESATEALEVLDEIMMDLNTKLIVISDWLMPVVKGDEFLIKVHSKYPKALKIMLTGQADLESIERTKTEANLYRCIRKPWMKNELISTIDSGILLT